MPILFEDCFSSALPSVDPRFGIPKGYKFHNK